VQWFPSVINKNITNKIHCSQSVFSLGSSAPQTILILWILGGPLWSSWHIFYCRAFLVMEKRGHKQVMQSPQSPTVCGWACKLLCHLLTAGISFLLGPPFGSDEEDGWGLFCQALVWLVFNGLYFHISRKITNPFLDKCNFRKSHKPVPESCLQK
jgi:hypothetical protein